MKNVAIYAFDSNSQFKTIDAAFTNFGMKMKEETLPGVKGLIYIDEEMQAELCKFIGYALANKIRNNNIIETVSDAETKHLQEIRKVLMHPNYSLIYSEFHKKLSKIKSAQSEAEKAAGRSGSSQLQAACVNCNDLVNKMNSFIENVSSDPQVMAVKHKADKFIEKNKAIHDSQFYTLGAAGTSFASEISGLTVNTQASKTNNIDESIADAKNNSDKNVNNSFNKFKQLITALLQGTSSVQFMLVNDGKYDMNIVKGEKIVKVSALRLEDIVNLKIREKLSIFPM